MVEAGRAVLDGCELRTDAEVVWWPDRYMDKRGRKMWDTIMEILDSLEGVQGDPWENPQPELSIAQ